MTAACVITIFGCFLFMVAGVEGALDVREHPDDRHASALIALFGASGAWVAIAHLQTVWR